MTFDPEWLRACFGLLPVLCFLAALLLLDSYKLVRLRMVLAVIAGGGVAAGVSYVVSVLIMHTTGLGFAGYSHYVAPLVEESLKASVIIILIRTHRIGFLVDATVLGFAVGAGFATVENLYYLARVNNPDMVTWVVRGFGTAIMHGGVQAVFAAFAMNNTDRRGRPDVLAFLPPLALAVLAHAAFNQFDLSPIAQTIVVLATIPPLLIWVFVHSERVLRGWLGSGFDADQELLKLLDADTFSQSRVGKYLAKLRRRLPGVVVADLLCYLHLYVELSLRAKGVLMLRENDIEVLPDEDTHAKLQEMRYLERSVGRSGLRTLRPLLHIKRRHLWQLRMLDE